MSRKIRFSVKFNFIKILIAWMLLTLVSVSLFLPVRRIDASSRAEQVASNKGVSFATPIADLDQVGVTTTLQSPTVMFIENVGQFDEEARFQVHGSDYTLWLAEDGLWLTMLEPVHETSEIDGSDLYDLANPKREPSHLLRNEVSEKPRRGVNLKLNFVGATPHPRLEPFDSLETKINYFLGNDPNKWQRDVPVWEGVRYVDIYPGLDLEISSQNGQLVQRMVMTRPNADLDAVRLRVEGADSMELLSSPEEGLRLTTNIGTFTFPLLSIVSHDDAPFELRRPPTINDSDVYAPFATIPTAHDAARHLAQVTEPTITFSTFVGGSGPDSGYAIALDHADNIVVTGNTLSEEFPTTVGGYDTSFNGERDVLVLKLSADGSSLDYITFVGGSDEDFGWSLALDSAGRAIVTGETWSADFPTTAGAYQTTYSGMSSDAFVLKLSSDGNLLDYSTFIGGNGWDIGKALVLDNAEKPVVTGRTDSGNFPTTAGAYDTTFNSRSDVFVLKLSTDGSSIDYSTFVGGSEYDYATSLKLDNAENIVVVGNTSSTNFPTTAEAYDTTFNGEFDTFVLKLSADGSSLDYSTFVGGSEYDKSNSLALDSAGNAVVTGETRSSDFPTTAGSYEPTYNGGLTDAFILKLSPDGSLLDYSTFMGGNSFDYGDSVLLDSANNALVTVFTISSDFPMTPGAYDTTNQGYDFSVLKLSADGSLLEYSTFVGGRFFDRGRSLALDSAGEVVIGGDSSSANFPTTAEAYDTTHNGRSDVFVLRFEGLSTSNVIHVKHDASGANDGSSWLDAYTDLQDALATAIAGDEIWVAGGTYKPTDGTDRTATFQLANGVAIYGGFNGTEVTRYQRDWQANPTILSGDLNGNDNNNINPNEATRADNSYHVVVGSEVDTSSLLDGFIITAGNANGTSSNSLGGGMLNENGSPTVSHVIFTNNSASYGGGMSNGFSNPTVSNVTFSNNFASAGGGMVNSDSSPRVSNVIFIGNMVSSAGGGMYNTLSNPTVSNTTFTGNFAFLVGGGVYNWNSAYPLFSHVIFSGNSASAGGGMHNINSNPTVSNSILWNNEDNNGTGATAQITGDTVSVSYSLVQGGWSGTGNINADPLFVSPIDPQDAPTTAGDFRLQPTSPAIDAGDNSAVPADTADLDEDGNITELLPLDLDGQPRFLDSPVADTGNGTPPLVDMGAYENVPPRIDNAPTEVTLNGPTTALVESNYAFTASVSPITTTEPITYVWEASGHTSVVHTAGLSDTMTFTWGTVGTKMITVTASNLGGLVTETYPVLVIEEPYEPNNSCQEAYQISASQLYTSSLSLSDKEDYYAIEVTEPFANLIVTKSDPEDYTLELYYDCTENGGLVRSIGSEQLMYNIGTETGWYYIRLNSPDDLYSSTPYTLQVDIQPTNSNTVQTLILVNRSRLQTLYGLERTSQLLARLNSLANHSLVSGVIIQVDQDPNVRAAYDLWDDSPENTSRANDVSVAIKNLLTSTLETFPAVQEHGYLVLVGDDRVIPYHRVHVYNYDQPYNFFWKAESAYAYQKLRTDQPTTIGAALFDNQTLTDDFYADFTPTPWRQDHDLYLPDLAIGRLVEEPEQMIAVIDAFLAVNGEVTLTTGAVSGYSIVRDVAQNQCNRLTNHGLSMDCSLVTTDPFTFTAQQLIQVMLQTSNNVAIINGETSHYEYLAPDQTAMMSSDVLSTSQELSGLFLYTTGSQSGLNVPPGEFHEIDLAQSLASRGITYVSHTGWTYGLGHTIGLTEKLLATFTQKVAEGTSNSVGYALTSAKQEYWLLDNSFDYYDEKIVIQATLFGLPMLQLETPNAHHSTSLTLPEAEEVKVSQTVRVSPETLSERSHILAEERSWVVDHSLPATLSVIGSEYQFPSVIGIETEDGIYYTTAGLALSNPYEPIQPMFWHNLGSSVGQARGVLMLNAVYGDESGFNPVIEGVSDLNSLQATNSITEPLFTAEQFYPALPHQFKEISSLGGENQEMLVISVGQYNSNTETERTLDSLTVDVYYGNSNDNMPPDIGTLSYIFDESAQLTVPVTDTNEVHRVVATYTTGPSEDEDGNFSGEWLSIDLTSNGDGTWTGTIPLGSWFFIQAVDTAGNVALDDNNGQYHMPALPLSISRRDSDVILSWPHLGTGVRYEIWRSDEPDFTLTDSSAIKLGTYAPSEGSETLLSVGEIISHTDVAAVSRPDNDYYLINAVNTISQTVATSNRVGKFKITVFPGWNLLALPLLPHETTLDAIIGTQLYGTENSFTADRVLVWDGESQGYEVAWFCGGAECESWGEPWANHWLANDYSRSPLTISPNQGFWLQNRSGATETLVIVGQVAEKNHSVEVGEGWQLLGPAFLENLPLDEANLSATGTSSSFTADRILYWDAATQAYKVAWFCGGAECESWGEPWANHWLANNYSPTDIELLPGHGFWYQNRHQPFTWNNYFFIQ